MLERLLPLSYLDLMHVDGKPSGVILCSELDGTYDFDGMIAVQHLGFVCSLGLVCLLSSPFSFVDEGTSGS